MLKIKKIWLLLLWIMLIFEFNFQYAQWLRTEPRDHDNQQRTQNKDRPSVWKIGDSEISGTDDIWSWSKAIADKSLWIINLPQSTDYENELWYVIALIQIAVNRTLWILSFITLIFILYNWFLILSSGSDSKNAEKWKKWITTSAIALAGIAISRLIISIMIRLIRSFS